MPTEAERRANAETRKRVDHLFRIYRAVAVALVIGGLATIGGGALAFVRIGQVVDAQDRAQDRLADLVRESDRERFRNARRACLEQNARHDGTVRTLDARLRMAPPAQARRAAESRDFTVSLIDALAPKRPNCTAYARELVAAK